MTSPTQPLKTQKALLSVFALPLEIGSRMLYEEDLEEKGFLNLLEGLSAETRKILLQHTQTLVSIKPELGYHFLFKAKALLELIGLDSLDQWVTLVLDIFDVKGLNPAKEFILAPNDHPLFLQHWGLGVSFHDIHGILHNYVHALGHRDFHLEPASTHYTDTLTIYVPERISTFTRKEDNALLYKIMVTHKFLQTELGTYRLDPKNIHDIETAAVFKSNKEPRQENAPPLLRFLNRFPDAALVKDLFNFMETIRIETWMGEYLPGLYREMNRLKKDLCLKRKTGSNVPPKSRIMDNLIRRWLTGDGNPLKNPDWERTVREIHQLMDLIRLPHTKVEDTAMIVTKAYHAMDHIPGPYEPVASVPFIGHLRPEEAERGRLKRREAARVQFREELAKMIEDLPQCEQVEIEIPGMLEADETQIKKAPQQQMPYELLIDGIPVPIP
ncbi:MAG TPA: hypothetical protein VKA69_06005, partial [Desulfobacteria bacterium]|nr:hypothetical protein [Desulfobacteria bacterium]